MHLSHERVSFLAGFAESTQGRLYRQVLEERLAEVDRTLRVLTGDDLYRAQGKAQAFEELVKQLDEAKNVLNRSSAARSQGTRRVTSN